PVNLRLPRIRIKLHEKESVREFLDKGELLLLFNRDEPREQHYSNAARWVVGATAMPPQHRPFFDPFICEAFELTVTRLMLASENQKALQAFEDSVLRPALLADDRVSRYCFRFETVHDAGFFTR